MATLNTTNIKHASSSSNNITLAADGSTTISNLSGGVGKILQVVQTVRLMFFQSVGQGTFTNAILSATITPTSSSNKILVIASLSISMNNDNRCGLGIFRGSIISGATGDADNSNRVAVSSFLSSVSYQVNMNVNFLDSPSTTSATTYDIRGTHGRNSTATFYVGRETQPPLQVIV